MSIYSPVIITEEIIAKFVPTRLYIKRHSVTGLRYLGKSILADVSSYKGSGKRWVNHIKKHGKELVVNDWLSDWFTDPHDLQEFALFLSEELDIVNSDSWANLKAENGLTGGRRGYISPEECASISRRTSGENNPMYGTSRSGAENPFFGKNHNDFSKEKMRKNPEQRKERLSTTMLKIYGVDHPWKSEEVKNKSKTTNLEKYGVENYAQTPRRRQELSQDRTEKAKRPLYLEIKQLHHELNLKIPHGTYLLSDDKLIEVRNSLIMLKPVLENKNE